MTQYGSACSGIEAATVAWHPLGWRAEWFAEIEPFPSAVLAYRWPEVPNLGDMITIARPPNTLEQDMQKQCTKCGETKLLPDAFHLSSKSSDGHASWCKACVNSIRRENRKRTYTTENKQKWAIKTRYGLTPSDVQAMLEKQGGACAICVLPLTKHHIDHCHTTGKVRGLLCHRCNTRLGGLDDKQWRDAAFRYLGLQA